MSAVAEHLNTAPALLTRQTGTLPALGSAADTNNQPAGIHGTSYPSSGASAAAEGGCEGRRSSTGAAAARAAASGVSAELQRQIEEALPPRGSFKERYAPCCFSLWQHAQHSGMHCLQPMHWSPLAFLSANAVRSVTDTEHLAVVLLTRMNTKRCTTQR